MQKSHHYTGLTDAQVIESRKKHGENILTPPEKEPLWKQFLKKLSYIRHSERTTLDYGHNCHDV
jgi:magnesium-transporting ATPase (P-type)